VALQLFREALKRNDPLPKEHEWLLEMGERDIQGKPAVTEAEYEVLVAWFRRNEAVISDISIRYKLKPGGARRLGATEVVEKLRSLRAMYPELQ
jgi:hypothetical protein